MKPPPINLSPPPGSKNRVYLAAVVGKYESWCACSDYFEVAEFALQYLKLGKVVHLTSFERPPGDYTAQVREAAAQLARKV